MIPTKDEVRRELVQWLDENWDDSRPLKAWRSLLLSNGWAAPQWPVEFYGRGYSRELADLVADTMNEYGAVGAVKEGPGLLASETLLAHGSSDQKKHYLGKQIIGEHSWCQLFSEPGSGSDLAGATTKAELDGDEWVINGQKVWTTSAHHADFGILLARTHWDLPKHQGLSYFVINMRQPGVEVRPLRQMNGYASFNEVFITDARVPKSDLVGKEGEGWAIARTTLAIERRGFSQRRSVPLNVRSEGPIYKEHRAELAVSNEPYRWYPSRTGRVDLVIDRAKKTGAIQDPLVRQEIAKLISLKQAADWTAMRAAAARAKPTSGSTNLGSSKAGPESSIGKLAASVIARQAAQVHTLIAGPESMLAGAEAPEGGVIAEVLLSVPAISIAGGTDEIQRNIIAERVLGMEKEQRSDKGPFRDVPRN